jgi:ATP-dependent exoDNAse (exonuclease V) beta subunit
LCNSRELDRLQQLVELADSFQPMATLRTADFIRLVEKHRMDSPSRSQVRVMTVHQAKGLEFDVAILGELETTLTPGNRPGFVTSEPDAFAKADGMCLYVSEFYQSLLPTDVQQMFRESARREIREALCLLYVAMTRAARALYMVCPPPPVKHDRVPATYAGLLSAALVGRNLAPSEIYSHGAVDWFNSLPEKLKHRRPRPATPSKSPIVFAHDVDGTARARARVSPSRGATTGRVRLSRVLQSVDQRTLDRGTLIHAWFESIVWLDDGRPSRESLRQIATELGAGDTETNAAISQFQAMLARPDITFALSRVGYSSPSSLQLNRDVLCELSSAPLRLEVERERRFVVRDGPAIVSGAIDRLVLMYHGDRLLAVDIIDFKTGTGTNDPAGLRVRMDIYRKQLASYARAVARIYQIEDNRISTRLLMLDTGRVEAVKWNATDSALNAE